MAKAKNGITMTMGPKESAQRFKELDEYIQGAAAAFPGDRQGALMGVLHKVQSVFGYIPREAMDFVSRKLSVPTAHIYGMATFYNFFSLKPKPRFKICTCKGTACYVGGGARILEKLKAELGLEEGGVTADGMFGLEITRCLGCCGLSPVMQVNEDIYVRMVPEKVPGILNKYRKLDKKQVKSPE
ncbi:MAG: NAD(P)H-dependent oxidoreductase subunit E [Candidatus Omnitrophica bacterium]|nr:NAD(P)H-dependent oxidoreductase subunit E [Candidatus Omnitrophota bacterium]